MTSRERHALVLLGVLLALAFGCADPPAAPTTPSPTPIPAPVARTLSIPVSPATAVATVTPDGQPALVGVTAAGLARIALPASVGPWGALLRVSAAGYRDSETRLVLPVADATLPAVALVALPSVAGCAGGRLVDPKAYFFALIGRQPGQRAADFVDVLLAAGIPGGPPAGTRADPTVRYGITQQRGGDGQTGRVVGRLFLPTDVPDGNGYYTRPVNILFDAPGLPPMACGSDPAQCVWDWQEWGTPPYTPEAPPYAPRPCP